ncbi:oxidoreductase [Georgenia sp. TF02-10]|uniref:oxidoreductase n=1 Tax=Georgenia sp. TF02-10 TaxID=2917725 RepID=UPI001FA7A8A0|nr:oxidoreductase [Georgenia sp. TF02-10]UNX53439.1 oxidoreductase [Georgenia sp. TF02-10]
MSLFRRRQRPRQRADDGAARAETLAHLRNFTATRTGVEAYLEPVTAHDPHTVVLVAKDGEWTRRRVPGPAEARSLAHELGIPIYDVHLTGYPARMRRWSSAHRGRR